MVWHTHMLNPRAFLEDAMLAGLRQFWVTGMPWDLVNKAIDTNFNYTVSSTCKDRWAVQTGLLWDNVDGPHAKRVRCPQCYIMMDIPWTTCQSPQVYDGEALNLVGNGYGDGDLKYACQDCGLAIRKELLSVMKFVDDHKALITRGRPMPGTLLDPRTGTPSKPPEGPKVVFTKHTYPNRLLKSIPSTISGLLEWRLKYLSPTMHHVRKEIEHVLSDRRLVKKVENVPETWSYKLAAESRVAIRKMMSRYWENFGLFALDLVGAVMRQGVFVEKMCQLDWLHSPSVSSTMARLITKYNRFIEIMRKNPAEVAVPTLDVDLAWHTHQLSPSRYYRHTTVRTARFIDHDDKIDEGMLSKQFEWTSKMYEHYYGEVYSECTCWYCEGLPPVLDLIFFRFSDPLSYPIVAHQRRQRGSRFVQA